MPRRYTPVEVEAIAISLERKKICEVAVEDLQEAVEGYQWAAASEDKGTFPDSTNKGRRRQLIHIIWLCAKGAAVDEIQGALNKLDAPTSQRLGPIDASDLKRIARAARRVVEGIPTSGPDPKRARQQFIRDLASIYYRLTGDFPGRWVLDQESDPFRAFVIAALNPIDAWHKEFVSAELDRTPAAERDAVRDSLKKASVCHGYEADIKVVLQKIKLPPQLKKSAAISKH